MERINAIYEAACAAGLSAIVWRKQDGSVLTFEDGTIAQGIYHPDNALDFFRAFHAKRDEGMQQATEDAMKETAAEASSPTLAALEADDDEVLIKPKKAKQAKPAKAAKKPKAEKKETMKATKSNGAAAHVAPKTETLAEGP